MILSGMVIYISTFKAEVGNKLRPKSTFQDPMFTYSYGYSFLFAVVTLILSELAGTFAIFLYIKLHQLEYKKETDKLQYVDYLQATDPPDQQSFFCKRHGSSRARRYSRTRELSRDVSPCPVSIRTSRQGSLNVPNAPLNAESMRDSTYFNYPPFSRETTCNTVSTSADINREFSREIVIKELNPPLPPIMPRDHPREFSPRREFSYDTLRRTTPV